jgi:hypothetical protein
MSAETDKLVCDECDARVRMGEVLSAVHPFDPGEHVIGCPRCKEQQSFRTCCDEPGCWEEDTMGTPATFGSPRGYRRTCYKHRPGA